VKDGVGSGKSLQSRRGTACVGVLGPTTHLELPLKVLLGVGRCYRL
jgi:hypothetical protein